MGNADVCRGEGGFSYRVAMYGHKSIPSREGGIEVVVQELAVRLVLKGCDVTCINRGGNHAFFEPDNNEIVSGYFRGVKIETVPTIDKGGLAALSSSFAAAWKTAFGKYDIVHIHAEGPAAWCWIPKLFGKKVVVTIHGLDWKRKKWKGFARAYIRLGEIAAARFADRIIVLSRTMKLYFYEKHKRKTIYLPNGMSESEYAEPDLIKYKYGVDKGDYILYLGRLVPEKNADILIEAFKGVITEKKLLIAGADFIADQYIRRLHKMAEDDRRICFTGFVKGRVLEEIMSNAYIFVLPSSLEGMPLSLLEAMSYGVCCITSDIPECSEVIEKCGIVVEKENTEALKNALQRLIDDPQLVEKLKRETKKVCCERDDWNTVTEKTLGIYKSLLIDAR